MTSRDHLCDVNVWLGLVLTTHPLHATAGAFISSCTRQRRACFCRATEHAFLRLLTTGALQRAYGIPACTNADAIMLLGRLISLPQITLVEGEPAGIRKIWHRLAALPSASPGVWMDAYLAAHAIASGASLVTADTGFRRWEPQGLRMTLLPA